MRRQGVPISVILIKIIEDKGGTILKSDVIIPDVIEKNLLSVKPNIVRFTKYTHLSSCTEENKKLVESFNETVKQLYPDVSEPDYSLSSKVVFDLSGNRFLEYRINQNSIRVFPNSNYKDYIDVAKVKEVLANKLNRNITESDIIFA